MSCSNTWNWYWLPPGQDLGGRQDLGGGGQFISRPVKLKRRRLTKFLTEPAPPPSTSARNFLLGF